MLAADKLQLQSTLKQQATALKEKEFNLHHNNFMTVGTQAAVLAGLDVTMFIEFQPPPNSEWQFVIIPRTLKFVYYVCITSAFCANILVVAQTTILSVLGASLALRGPDGSMMTATDGLYLERAMVFRNFGYGLVLTIGSVLMVVWLHLHWEASIVCCALAVFTMKSMRDTYYRVLKKFDFDESLTVDFQDIFDGPAAITAVPVRRIFAEGMRGIGLSGGRGVDRKLSTDAGGKLSFDELDEEEVAMVRRQRMTNGSRQNSSLQTV
mmetsp:Transcript_20159/g.43443  ORF Transcript_20159/g.43443 Transcript_20159/m.43443 type:complete len:266 (-) Transcript_20159:1116-1913(-)|eukprot:g5347.t1 g5347   contig2:345409-346540(+)